MKECFQGNFSNPNSCKQVQFELHENLFHRGIIDSCLIDDVNLCSHISLQANSAPVCSVINNGTMVR